MAESNQRSQPLKQSILSLLREEGTYCSGSEIGRITGVSRTAVWKAVNQLRGEGHQILGRTHLGYKLEREADILSRESLKQAIQAWQLDNWLKRVVFEPEAESTNTMARHAAESSYAAMRYAAETSQAVAGHTTETSDVMTAHTAETSHAATGHITESLYTIPEHAEETSHHNPEIFVVRQQKGGRGRRGRKWLSDLEGSLTFSLLLRPETEPKSLSAITLLAGLCTVKAINKCIGKSFGNARSTCRDHSVDGTSQDAYVADPIGIKWPNDLVDISSGQKIGGLLTEMLVEENSVNALIIGIGLNINNQNFPQEIASRATSIFKATHRRLLRVDVLCHILSEIRSSEKIFTHPKLWLDEYRAHCLTLGQFIDVHHANGSVERALAVDIDPTGALIIEDNTGQRTLLHSGEVSIRVNTTYNDI